MRIKDGFVLRDVASSTMVIAVGERSKTFKGMIKMNKTAKDIWLYIEQGLDTDQIVFNMSKKYNESEDKVKEDVLNIISSLLKNDIIEE